MTGHQSAHITIKEAAVRLGVTHRTLKYYEELGMVIPGRSGGRYRLYSENDLIRLQRIIRLRALGFSLSTIREILSRPPEQNEQGVAEYSRDTLCQIAAAIEAHLETVSRRIEAGRRELCEAEKVKKELLDDLDYLNRRLAGESSETLAEERLSARVKQA
ncbi:TPA: MerR family transcriptional regulator [Klebsiella oxytoca]|uniref:MerR family transcriptional regulator n=1 Tax=Klebsiella oxytoca TaxID=571 RepID=A0AAN5LEU9_KLEOX|nr:MerR family transcriptional regulator [Klebsiella oxytoca]